jgi:copper(I)-binding protein
MLKPIAALSALLLAATPLLAHEYRRGAILADHPVIRVVSPQSKTGAGFMTISNNGPTADRLLAVKSDAAGLVQLHESLSEGGMMTMRPLGGGVPVAAGAKVQFAPGGKHVMFIGLKAPVTPGQRLKSQLVFQNAGTIDVEFLAEGVGNAKAETGHNH